MVRKYTNMYLGVNAFVYRVHFPAILSFVIIGTIERSKHDCSNTDSSVCFGLIQVDH